MNANTTSADSEYSKIRQEHFDLIRKKLTALAEVIVENIHTQSQASQDVLCAQMMELATYVKELYHRPLDLSNDNGRDFEGKIKWIDTQVEAILETLKTDRPNS